MYAELFTELTRHFSDIHDCTYSVSLSPLSLPSFFCSLSPHTAYRHALSSFPSWPASVLPSAVTEEETRGGQDSQRQSYGTGERTRVRDSCLTVSPLTSLLSSFPSPILSHLLLLLFLLSSHLLPISLSLLTRCVKSENKELRETRAQLATDVETLLNHKQVSPLMHGQQLLKVVQCVDKFSQEYT